MKTKFYYFQVTIVLKFEKGLYVVELCMEMLSVYVYAINVIHVVLECMFILCKSILYCGFMKLLRD